MISRWLCKRKSRSTRIKSLLKVTITWSLLYLSSLCSKPRELQESQREIKTVSRAGSSILTVRYWNPRTETIPATTPMNMAEKGWIARSAQVPTATPPARVAFWMRTCRGDTEVTHEEQRLVLGLGASEGSLARSGLRQIAAAIEVGENTAGF